MNPAPRDILVEVLRKISDEGSAVFADPKLQAAAWHCAECGFIADRRAEFPHASNVTGASMATVRGAWRWGPLTPEGERFLDAPDDPAFHGPREEIVTDSMLARRAQSLEDARARAEV